MNTTKPLADYQTFCKKQILEIPDITPSDMCHNMHLAHYAMVDCASAIHQFFQKESADSVCQILLGDFFHPPFEKNAYQDAMLQAPWQITIPPTQTATR